MMKEQIRVRDWMVKFGQETHNNNPTIPSLEVRKLRAKLILEEALETVKGLGFDIDEGNLVHDLLHVATIVKPNLIEIADGIADSLVVQLGTAVACGIDIEPVFEEVMRSNDSKLWTNKEVAEHYKTTVTPDSKQFDCEHHSCIRVNVSEDHRDWLVEDNHGKVLKSPSYSPANIKL